VLKLQPVAKGTLLRKVPFFHRVEGLPHIGRGYLESISLENKNMQEEEEEKVLQIYKNRGTSRKATSSGRTKSGTTNGGSLPPVVPKSNAKPQYSADTSI
jgi:hypothetical protein